MGGWAGGQDDAGAGIRRGICCALRWIAPAACAPAFEFISRTVRDALNVLQGRCRSSTRAARAALRCAGEFQFAFLAFLLGQSLEGFAQWRAFLALLLGCEAAALGARAGLFARFLEAFHAQLEHSVDAAQVGVRGS